MFFQSPRPFGQHSTSYRSMSNSMHPSSSMTSLQIPEPKSGRISVPPISFASVHEGSRFGPLGSPMDQTFVSNTDFEQTRISKESSHVVRSSESFTPDSKNYEKHTTTSLHNSPNSGRTSGQNLKIFQPEVHIPTSKSNVFQVQRHNVNQQQPSWVFQTQSRELQPEQTLQNVSSCYKEYHRSSTTNQGNRFRSGSAVPFTENSPKPVVNQSQPVPIFSTGGYASFEPTHEQGSFTEARVRSSAQFNASQEKQQQKPIAYQQLERRKNYATLHHVASPRMGPLQRRTSDPNLLKISGNDLPGNIAMFNVAKGVRAELEQDPKFRRRADILGNLTAAEPTVGTFSSPPSLNKEHPKQSPSLRQIENFFEHNVQQLHNVIGPKRPPPVPSAKPFNVEHVRSIFRTNNTVCTDSSPVTIPTSVDTQVKQDNPLLGQADKPIKLIEMHESQERMSHDTLKKDTQTSGIIRRHIISTSQNSESTGNAGNLVEQKACSVSETGKENTQAKPTTFTVIVNEPVIITGSDKSPETRKEIAIQQEQPNVSQDIVTLEKDYDSFITFVIPRRLNEPFPVDGATYSRGSQKTQNTASPLGILMKDGNGIRSVNDSGIKTQKKVAFQCDRNNIGFTKNESEESKTSAETPPSVVQYDDAIDEPLQKLLKLSADIGGDLQAVGSNLSALFAEQRNFIWSAAGQKEPSIEELQAKLNPLVKLMEELSAFKESKRNTPFFNHISAASEGVQALGWLTVKPAPAPFIKEMFEASMFFVNRVLKEHKDDKIHTEWVKSWSDVLNALQKYVRQVHTTGLVWNSCPGTKPPALAKQVGSNITSSGGPPPPPILPPDLFTTVSSETNVLTDKSDRAALFAEINAGEKIAKRLKKVTPNMQTHKNPALRSQHKEVDAGAQNRTGLTAAYGTSSSTKQADKPPKTWLDNGKQWNVEYYKNNNNVIVEVRDMKQTVYAFKCENSVIQIKGKVNSVTLDSCKKTSVVFDNLLSQFEVINCQSVQIQTLGSMPTLSIQKTDGCQVYLSKSAINAEIITSKSSEMNVLVPGAEDGDFQEEVKRETRDSFLFMILYHIDSNRRICSAGTVQNSLRWKEAEDDSVRHMLKDAQCIVQRII